MMIHQQTGNESFSSSLHQDTEDIASSICTSVDGLPTMKSLDEFLRLRSKARACIGVNDQFSLLQRRASSPESILQHLSYARYPQSKLSSISSTSSFASQQNAPFDLQQEDNRRMINMNVMSLVCELAVLEEEHHFTTDTNVSIVDGSDCHTSSLQVKGLDHLERGIVRMMTNNNSNNIIADNGNSIKSIEIPTIIDNTKEQKRQAAMETVEEKELPQEDDVSNVAAPHDPLEMAKSWNSAGLLHLHTRQNPKQAIQCHQMALMILREGSCTSSRIANSTNLDDDETAAVQQHLELVSTWHDIGLCYEKLHNQARALESYQRGLSALHIPSGTSSISESESECADASIFASSRASVDSKQKSHLERMLQRAVDRVKRH